MLQLLTGLYGVALAAPDVVDPDQPTDPAEVAVEQVLELSVDEAYVETLTTWLQEISDLSPDDAREQAQSMALFEAMLPWVDEGPVDVAGVATMTLHEGDRWLGGEGAGQVLEAWGNPPGQLHAGMLFAKGAHLFGPDSWGVIVDYEDMGWVDDGDAATIDYDELLADMQEGTRQEAVERREMGLDGIELVGWAEPPRYDPATNVLYWARTLRGDSGNETLNYEVRVLGRGGVLSLKALAGMDMLEQTRTAMEPVRVAATFVPGQTYADYEAGVDPTAGVGIAALVAGGALAATKGGLLKGLLAMLIAGKKFVIMGVVAIGALFARMGRSLFGGGQAAAAEED